MVSLSKLEAFFYDECPNTRNAHEFMRAAITSSEQLNHEKPWEISQINGASAVARLVVGGCRSAGSSRRRGDANAALSSHCQHYGADKANVICGNRANLSTSPSQSRAVLAKYTPAKTTLTVQADWQETGERKNSLRLPMPAPCTEWLSDWWMRCEAPALHAF